MNRRDFMERGTGGAMAASLASSANLSCGASGGGKPPNIILAVSDDTGWNDVGWHGSEIDTPVLDHLAETGLDLDRFYAWPVCSPTRAALLTGRPPSRFGILGPIAMRSTLALPKDVPTLAESLSNQGYRTAISGKWHLGLSPETGPNAYDFQRSYGYLHGQIDQFTHIYKNGDPSWHRDGSFIDEEGHATDLIADEAVDIIGEWSGRDAPPFFLYVPFSVPHYPLQEEEQWTEPYRGRIENESRRIFAASMTHMDAAIGRIIDAVEEQGIGDDTIFVFMSDNGGQESWTPTFEYGGKFEANDRLGDNAPLRGWKGELYEGGIRVPALIHAPGRFTSAKIEHTISACDLYPTLAALSGGEAPGVVEGIDVTSALGGGTLEEERTLYRRTGSRLAVRVGEWKLVHAGPSPGDGTDELFNVIEDPCETRDRAGNEPEILARLGQELERQFAMDA